MSTMSGGYVAVYSPGSTQPQTYSDPDLLGYGYCTYDNRGNLFFLSATSPRHEVLAEMTAGSHSFSLYSLTLNAIPHSLQWDGQYVTFETEGGRRNNPPSEVYRISVAASSAMVAGITKLDGAHGGIWIEGTTALSGPLGAKRRAEGYMAYYKYPKGGKPYDVFTKLPPGPIHTFAILPAPQSP
jgi:hypothetical protein